MTLTEITSIGTVIAVIGGGTLWFETRYERREDAIALERRIDELESTVERGHRIAELRSNIFTIQKMINDLAEREAMYRAWDRVGALTDEQRGRWVEVQETIRRHQAEISNIGEDLRGLQ